MKVLLLGKGGQVGWELQRSLAPLGEVAALDFDSVDLCGDFSDSAGLVATVRRVAPDVIVNAAAYTAVDRAESEPELARKLGLALRLVDGGVCGGVDDDVRAQSAHGVGDTGGIAEVTAVDCAVMVQGRDAAQHGEAALQLPADLAVLA